MKNLLLFIISAVACYGSPIPEFPFLKVREHVQKEVKPDKAVIKFEVLHFSEKSEDATTAVNEILKNITDELIELGVKKEELEASDFSKRAKRKKDENQYTIIIGYEVRRDVQVEINDLKRYTPVMRAILKLDGTSEVNSTFEAKDKDKYLDELMVEACEKARKKAERIAKASGSTLGKLHAVSDMDVASAGGGLGFGYDFDGDSLLPPAIGASGADLLSVGGGAPAPVFAPTKIELRTKVTMLFKLN